MIVLRDDLKKYVHDQLSYSIYLRDKSVIKNIENDLAPNSVIMCLGPGRCLIPRYDNSVCMLCPFCHRYPDGANTAKLSLQKIHANIVLNGN